LNSLERFFQMQIFHYTVTECLSFNFLDKTFDTGWTLNSHSGGFILSI